MQQDSTQPIDFDAWRRAIREDTFANYHYQMGLALERTGDLDSAEAAYARALAIHSGHWASYGCLITLLERRGRTAEAATVRERGQRASPDFMDRWLEKQAEEAIESSRLEDAISLLRRTQRPTADGAALWAQLAAIYRRQGRHADALTAVGAALDIQPALLEARREQGLLLRIQGRIDDAMTMLGSVLARMPDDLEVAGTLAFCHLVRLEADQALAITAPLCRAPTKQSFVDSTHATALQALGRYDEAASYLHALPQVRDTGHHDRWWLLCYEGLSLQAAGRPADALSCYQDAQASCPDSLKHHARSYVGLGLQGIGDLSGALAEHEAVAGHGEANAWLHSNHALALLALGRDAEAMALLARALACPDAPYIPLHGHQRPWATAQLEDSYRRLQAG